MSIICVLFFFRYITFILLTKLLRLHPQLPLSPPNPKLGVLFHNTNVKVFNVLVTGFARLGVLFHNPNVKIFNVLVTAGRTVLRLFMCSEDSVVTGKTVRRVVDKVVDL